MLPEQITDPNIFRCAFKKGNAVIAKHLLWICILIDVLAGCGVAYLGFTNLLLPNALIAFGYTESYLGYVYGILLSIAWYWYAVTGMVVVYYGYGLVWCIARDLTEEDWKSDSATNFAFAFAFAALAFAFVLAAIDPGENITVWYWYYVIRFFGAAWNHYKKRN
jgi:hypothetical protein